MIQRLVVSLVPTSVMQSCLRVLVIISFLLTVLSRIILIGILLQPASELILLFLRRVEVLAQGAICAMPLGLNRAVSFWESMRLQRSSSRELIRVHTLRYVTRVASGAVWTLVDVSRSEKVLNASQVVPLKVLGSLDVDSSRLDVLVAATRLLLVEPISLRRSRQGILARSRTHSESL